MKYKIHTNNLSEELVYETNSLKDLLQYGEKNEIMADCITINDLIAYDWDEIEMQILG